MNLTDGCRMSYDPQLYYNPEAEVLPVVREKADLLKPYEGTKSDDDGTVIWYPDYEERERIEFELLIFKRIIHQRARFRKNMLPFT